MCEKHPRGDFDRDLLTSLITWRLLLGVQFGCSDVVFQPLTQQFKAVAQEPPHLFCRKLSIQCWIVPEKHLEISCACFFFFANRHCLTKSKYARLTLQIREYSNRWTGCKSGANQDVGCTHHLLRSRGR